MKKLLIALMLCGTILPTSAKSADYYAIGIGQTNLERNTQFGWWSQSTSDQVFQETTPSWAIRAGWDVSRELQLEAGYRDSGTFSTVGSYISDAGYAAAMAGQCTFPCGEQVVSVYGQGKLQGIDLRAKYGPRIGQFRPYVVAGLFAYHSTYSTVTIEHDNSGTVKGDTHWRENRIRLTYSVGIEYKTAFIEYTIDRHVGVDQGAFDKAKTLYVGVRF